MTDHTIGDAPIDPKYRKQMQDLAAGLDHVLNGTLRGNDRKTGFVLLVFPYGDETGSCNYISNGADRKDIVTMFKEQIKRFEAQAAAEAEGKA